MENKNVLSNEWFERNHMDGEMAKFNVELDKLDQRTVVKSYPANKIRLLFAEQTAIADRFRIGNVEPKQIHSCPVEIIEDAKKTKTVFLVDGDKEFACSEFAVVDAAERAGCNCNSILNASASRNQFINENLARSNKNVSLVFRRNEDDSYKIFAARGGVYEYIPQKVLYSSIIETLERELGKSICDNWCITNETTYLDLRFPEKEQELSNYYHLGVTYTPVVRIENSDIGLSAVKVIPELIDSKGNIISRYSAIASQEHNAQMANIIPKTLKKVFPEFELLYNRLEELQTTVLPIEETINEIFDFIKKKTKNGHKRFLDAIKEAAIQELQLCNNSCEASAYDIFTKLIEASQNGVCFNSKGEEKEIAISSREAIRSWLSEAMFSVNLDIVTEQIEAVIVPD